MDWDIILNEIVFKTSRSSGPGGQHVNKTETKVEVIFDIFSSNGLTPNEKSRLAQALKGKLIHLSLIKISVSETRSQLKNKQIAIHRLEHLLVIGLKKKKKRIPTKKTKSSIEKRLKGKKKNSELKKNRRNIT